jgi:hypothetical protein
MTDTEYRLLVLFVENPARVDNPSKRATRPRSSRRDVASEDIADASYVGTTDTRPGSGASSREQRTCSPATSSRGSFRAATGRRLIAASAFREWGLINVKKVPRAPSAEDLSRASCPFTEPILKGSKGADPASAFDMVETGRSGAPPGWERL